MAEADLPQVDVAIAGGGPVASALALALAGGALSVARIADDAEAADRPIALSHGSRLILERLGAWGRRRRAHRDHPRFPAGIRQNRDALLGLRAAGPGIRRAYSELVANLAGRTVAVVPGTP